MKPNQLTETQVFILLFLFPIITLTKASQFDVDCRSGFNYTQDKTPFQTNLYSIFLILNSTSSTSLYHRTSVGSAPDKAYAAFSCRYDLPLPTCHECVSSAISDLLTYCPAYWEAVALYPLCAVQYANRTLFSTPDFAKYTISCDDPRFGEDLLKTAQRTLSGLIQKVTSAASRNSTFNGGYYVATGEESYMVYQKVHGLVQCAPDLTPSDCLSCLNNELQSVIEFCNGTLGATAIGVRCSVMYSLYSFSNSTHSSSLSAPPPTQWSQLPTGVQPNLSQTISCPGILSAAVLVGTLGYLLSFT